MTSKGNNQNTTSDPIESLRLILERQQHKTVAYDEAREIGDTLISFFELLATLNAGDGLRE